MCVREAYHSIQPGLHGHSCLLLLQLLHLILLQVVVVVGCSCGRSCSLIVLDLGQTETLRRRSAVDGLAGLKWWGG